MVVVHLAIYGLDLMNRRGMRWYKLDCWFGSRQLRLDWGGGRGEWRRSDRTERQRAVATSRAHRSSPPSAPGLGDLGFLVQNGAEGKGILTRGTLTAGWVPRWLTAVAWSSWSSTVAHDLDWASLASRSSSKASPRFPQAPPWFNCFGQQWIELARHLSSCAWVSIFADQNSS
jgi:hypothetical protein